MRLLQLCARDDRSGRAGRDARSAQPFSVTRSSNFLPWTNRAAGLPHYLETELIAFAPTRRWTGETINHPDHSACPHPYPPRAPGRTFLMTHQ